MVSQTALFNYESSTFQIPYSLINNQLWFKATDVATTLGYANTQQAIRVNVDDDDRTKLGELEPQLSDSCLDPYQKQYVYINESGLYSLVLRSDKPEAKAFNKWIFTHLFSRIHSYNLVHLLF